MTHLVNVEVFDALGIFFKKLSRPMTKKLVVGNLKLKGSVIPCIVKGDIIRVNEGQLLVLTFVFNAS